MSPNIILPYFVANVSTVLAGSSFLPFLLFGFGEAVDLRFVSFADATLDPWDGMITNKLAGAVALFVLQNSKNNDNEAIPFFVRVNQRSE